MTTPNAFEKRAAEIALEQARLAFISARGTYQRLKAMKKLEDLRAAQSAPPVAKAA